MNYFVISPTYNSQEYISKCIQSVKNQVLPENVNVFHIIINDASIDKTRVIINEHDEPNSNLYVVNHKVRLGPVRSHLDGKTIANTLSTSDEDVIIHLDGDDWFSCTSAIERIHKEYLDFNCFATYGNYETTNGSPSVNKPLSNTDFRDSIVTGWCYSHPRTFKLRVFNKFKFEDSFDSKGNMFLAAADVVLFLPILEMCGKDRVRYIPDKLVMYNVHNPLNEHKVALNNQVNCALELYRKPRYAKI